MKDPIKVDESGCILDGHSRFAIDLSAPPQVVKGLSEAEKKAFVFRSNLTRRNLAPAQKAELRKKQKVVALDLREEDPKKNTQEEVAGLLGVARETVRDWFTHDGGSANTHNSPPPEKPDGRRTLTREGKAKAIAEVQAGKSQEQVAANMGVDQSTIIRTVSDDAKKKDAARARRKAAKKAEALGELGIENADYQEAGSEIAALPLSDRIGEGP